MSLYVSQIGTLGSGNDQFDFPAGITTDGTYIYVCDQGNLRIKKHLCSDLSYVGEVSQRCWHITTDGVYLYITDAYNEKIVKRLCSDLSYISEIGSYGAGDDQTDSIFGIATDGTYLYVTDGNNDRIVKRLCSDLSYVSQIGTYGGGNDQFDYPTGIAVDSSGTYLYVNDYYNHRYFKRLCSDLSYVETWNYGMINQYGAGMAYGYNQFQTLYVVPFDATGYHLWKIKISDKSLYQDPGSSHGSWDDNLNIPDDVVYYNQYLYISDTENHRIMKRIDSPPGTIALSSIVPGVNRNTIFMEVPM